MDSKKITVTVFDGRQGHDGCANGGHFGGFESLLVKVKDGCKLEEAVVCVSDVDNGKYQTGNRLNWHETSRTSTYEIDPTKVEWACVCDGYDAQPGLRGRSSKCAWHPVSNAIPGGPKVQLQKFLEDWQNWSSENRGVAGDWLEETARRLDNPTALEAISYACRKSCKGTIGSAWRGVSEAFGVSAEWSSSWTGVRSAPLKVALAVQKKHQFRGKDAFRWVGQRPVHPGEAKDYVSLP